jgi:hypothetical protein
MRTFGHKHGYFLLVLVSIAYSNPIYAL